MSEKTTNTINDIDLDLIPGGKEFIALLELSDEEFSAVAPTMLKIVEDAYNKPEVRSSLINETSGPIASPKDFREELEKTLKEELSDIKIDFIVSIYSIAYNIINEEKKENNIAIAIERCNKDAKLPLYANINDAGMDVYALEDITILPGETKLIKLGIKVAIPEGYELQIRPRSGQSLKTKLRIANSPGTIDAGYRGEIGVIVENIDNPIKDIQFHYENSGQLVVDSIATGAPIEIIKGQRFAQLVLAKVYHANFYRTEKVEDIGVNRNGGFGSSGK